MIAVALGRLPLQLARSVKPAVVRVTARHNSQTPLNASMNALRYHLLLKMRDKEDLSAGGVDSLADTKPLLQTLLKLKDTAMVRHKT
jgi:hypothetical protein